MRPQFARCSGVIANGARSAGSFIPLWQIHFNIHVMTPYCMIWYLESTGLAYIGYNEFDKMDIWEKRDLDIFVGLQADWSRLLGVGSRLWLSLVSDE